MNDLGAFVPIGAEYHIVVTRALTITATATCLIAAISHELIALSLSVGAETNLDFDFDGCRVVATLEDGWDACGLRDARFPLLLLLGLNQGGTCADVAPRAARRSTAVVDDFVQSKSRPFIGALGALCTGACDVRGVRGI